MYKAYNKIIEGKKKTHTQSPLMKIDINKCAKPRQAQKQVTAGEKCRNVHSMSLVTFSRCQLLVGSHQQRVFFSFFCTYTHTHTKDKLINITFPFIQTQRIIKSRTRYFFFLSFTSSTDAVVGCASKVLIFISVSCIRFFTFFILFCC